MSGNSNILTQVTNEYLALSQGMNSQWVTAHNKKENPMIKVVQAQIKTLQERIKLLSWKKEDAHKMNHDGNLHVTLNCRKCKKKWHIVKFCLDKKDASEKKEGKADKDSKKTDQCLYTRFLQKKMTPRPRRSKMLSAHGAINSNDGQRVRRRILWHITRQWLSCNSQHKQF